MDQPIRHEEAKTYMDRDRKSAGGQREEPAEDFRGINALWQANDLFEREGREGREERKSKGRTRGGFSRNQRSLAGERFI
jgi:hypothetical protein